MFDRYGVTNVFQLDKVKARIMETNVSRYGCACPANNEGIREKIKKDNVVKYGVDYYPRCAEKAARSSAWLRVHQSTDEFKEKTKATCFGKYGVSSPLKSETVLNKLKATNNERYGVDFVFQPKEVRKNS